MYINTVRRMANKLLPRYYSEVKSIVSNRNSSIRALAKKLGEDYRVAVIDFEHVVYRDFGNGFNVEISGMYTTSKRKKATIYLWHDDRQSGYTIVTIARNVCRDDISSVVEELYSYSEELIHAGKDNKAWISTICNETGNEFKSCADAVRKMKLMDADAVRKIK